MGFVYPSVGQLLHAGIMGVGLWGVLLAIRGGELHFGTGANVSSDIATFRVGFGLACIAPLIEETVMRGFVFGGLRARHNLTYSLMVTVAINVVMHILGFASWVHDFLAICVSNLSFCLYKEICRSLWPAIVCHTIFNMCTFFGTGGK